MAGKPRFHFLLPEAFAPRYFLRVALGAMQQGAAIIRLLLPAGSGPPWRELQNKLCTLDLFLHAGARSDFAADSKASPLESMKAVQRLEPYARIWTSEGLAYRHALGKTAGPISLFSGAGAELVPAASLIPLHAGMGLAFARRFLKDCARPPSSNWPSVLNEFYRLCNLHGQEGYRGVVYESLGFAAQILYPELADEIDRSLRAMEAARLAHFWHGVGRAIYFAPRNLAPRRNSFRRAWEMVERKAPHHVARRNALAGLAFAVTLVNIRNPEILEYFVRHCAPRPAEDEAFASGASSAAVAWLDMTGDNLCLHALTQYQPHGLNEKSADAWECFVRNPCQIARERHQVLKESGRLDELFRCASPSGG